MSVTSRINATVLLPNGQPLPLGGPLYVLGLDDSSAPFPVTGLLAEPGRLVISLPEQVNPSVGLNLTVIAPNCQTWTGRALTPPKGHVIELQNPETKQPFGIELKAGNNPFKSARLPRLRAAGQFFQIETGDAFTAIECSDFKLYQLWLEGSDLTPILQQRKDLGFNMVRVFGSGVITFSDGSTMSLQPQGLGQRYYDELPHFFSALASFGLYGEFTAFAGAVQTMPNAADQISYWGQLGEVFPSIPSVLVERVNEADQASNKLVSIAQLGPLPGVLCSAGSNGSQALPVRPWWNYETVHLNGAFEWQRKTPHWPYECSNGAQGVTPSGLPVIANENTRCPDGDFNPTHFHDAAAGAALLAAGACFHSSAGRVSHLFDGQTLACAQAHVAGAKSVVLDCQPLPYHHDQREIDIEKQEGLLRAYRRGSSDTCLVKIRY